MSMKVSLSCETSGKLTMKVELACETSGNSTMKVELPYETFAVPASASQPRHSESTGSQPPRDPCDDFKVGFFGKQSCRKDYGRYINSLCRKSISRARQPRTGSEPPEKCLPREASAPPPKKSSSRAELPEKAPQKSSCRARLPKNSGKASKKVELSREK